MAILGRRHPIPKGIYTQPVYSAVTGVLAGSSGMSFVTSGTLLGDGALAGSAALSFSPSGTLAGDGALSGSTSFSFDCELGFVPTAITGCKLWLDPNDSTTMTSAKGQQRTWTDKSPEAQTYNFRTGRPGLLWTNPTDSTRKVMRLCEGSQTAVSANTAFLRLDHIASLLSSNFTLAFNSTYPKEAANNTIFGAGNSSNANTRLRLGLGPSTGAPRLQLTPDGSATITAIQQGASVAPELCTFVIIKNGTTYTIRRNGVQIASGTFSGTQTFDVCGFGVRPSNGVDEDGTGIVLGEVTFYDSALSGTDLSNLETYLMLNVLPVTNRYTHPTTNGGFLDARKQKLYHVTKIASGDPGIAPTYDTTFSNATLGYASGLTRYYADVWTGNDTTGDGSFSNPFATGKKAAAAGADIVVLFPGLQPNSLNGSYTQPELSMQFTCESGRAVVENAELVPAAWTKTGGFISVYEFTLTGSVSEVYDLTNETPISLQPINLTLVGSIALVDSTANSYFVTGGKVYIHTFDGRQGDRNIVVRIGASTVTLPFTSSGRFVSFQNITFGRGLTAFPQVQNMVLFIDAVRGYGSTEWGFGTNTVDGYATNCKVVHDSDAMDYRQTCTFLTQDCYYESRATDFAANAETGHVGACIVSVNSEYVGGNRTHHSITAALVWLMNPIVRDSIFSGTSPGGVGLAMGDIDTNSLQAARMWVEWPTLTGHDTQIIAANGCIIECRGLREDHTDYIELSGGDVQFLDEPPLTVQIDGATSLTFTSDGSVIGAGSLVGQSPFVFSATGVMSAPGDIFGSTSFVFSASLQLPINGDIDGWNLSSKNRLWNLSSKQRQWTLTAGRES